MELRPRAIAYRNLCLIGPANGGNLQGYWSGNHLCFEYAECYWSAFFYVTLCTENVTLNLCTESAVPEALKRLLGKGKGQDRRVTESVLCDPLVTYLP